MQTKFKVINVLGCLALAMLFTQCRKSNSIAYIDGTPGDGATVPSITVDTNVKNIDVSKYAQARVFPGLVCNTEPRLNNVQLTMDLNYNYVGEDLRISVPPQPQFSTGLYAAPGELVIIDVPQANYELSVQVGAWTDNLTGIENPPRDPLIYSKMQLAPGRNYVRNLYGGHIYIFAGRPISTPITLSFTNVVKSPDFVLGETTNAEWKEAITKSCVPWLEMRSKNIVFVVPREYCLTRPIADPTAALQEWDNIIHQDYYAWEGLSVNPAEAIDRAPLLAWRIVLDIKPVVGYGHSGFPVVAQNDYSWYGGIGNVLNIDGGGNWGLFHELGHNNQQTRYWSWSSLGETSNNLFAFKVANRLSAIASTAWPPKHPALATAVPSALAFAADPSTTKSFDGTDSRINDPFARLTPFLQLFDKVPAGSNYNGWDIMSELYKNARRASRISLNDQDKRDFFYETVCNYTKLDWIYFFNAWGITVSNISQTKMAKYPKMLQRIWTYNPLTRTGGDGIIPTTWVPYNTSTWVINSFSSQEAGGEGPQSGYAKAIIDRDINTFWHTRWSSSPPNPPHWIIIDMGVVQPVDGFVFTQRQSLTRNIKNIKVETSTDNVNWTLVSGSPFGLTQTKPAQEIRLKEVVNCRYVRITIPTTADVYDGTANAALAEFNTLHP